MAVTHAPDNPPASRPGAPPARSRMRPLVVAWTFFRIGALNELQYRVNFFIQLVQSMMSLATALVVIALVFSYTPELGGWTRPELLALIGVHIAMGGIIKALIQPNMTRLIQDIREGKLDHSLTKPEDAQLLVSVTEFRIWHLVDVLVGAIVIAVALVQFGGEPGASPIGVWGVLSFAFAFALGIIMIYCFWVILTVGAFWIVRVEFITELFDGLYQAGRWPITIYPGWLRAAFTFLVPLAFAVTVPAEALTGRLTGSTLGLATLFTLGIAIVTRLLWRIGLRNYSGASA